MKIAICVGIVAILAIGGIFGSIAIQHNGRRTAELNTLDRSVEDYNAALTRAASER